MQYWVGLLHPLHALCAAFYYYMMTPSHTFVMVYGDGYAYHLVAFEQVFSLFDPETSLLASRIYSYSLLLQIQ
jgi:hypothetical protein